MLNEERIILMTRMASYESKEGKENMKIGKYFRSDYIAVQLLKSVVSATVCYGLGLALYIFYDFDNFMQNIYQMDLFDFAGKVLVYYAVTVVAYGVLSYAIYSWRYAKAKKSLKCYYNNLKKLYSLYQEP